MKTLAQLGMHQHQTSNYADYSFKPSICCGWMDIHEDSDSLGDNGPIFSLIPLYWNPRAVFIYRLRKHWYQLSLKGFLAKVKVPGIKYQGKSFSFNATRYHGLVPKAIADQLCITPAFEQSTEYAKFVGQCNKDTTPKLVWQWVEPGARA